MRDEVAVKQALENEVRTDARLSVAEWASLPPSARISHYVVDAIVLLGMAREELYDERARSILSIDTDLDDAVVAASCVLGALQS